MKQHKLLVTWTMSAVVYYPGDTLEEAIDIAIGSENLPDGDYVDDSFIAEPAEYTGEYLSKIAPLRSRPESDIKQDLLD